MAPVISGSVATITTGHFWKVEWDTNGMTNDTTVTTMPALTTAFNNGGDMGYIYQSRPNFTNSTTSTTQAGPTKAESLMFGYATDWSQVLDYFLGYFGMADYPYTSVAESEYQTATYGYDLSTTSYWSVEQRASGYAPYGVAGVGSASDVYDGKHGMRSSDATDRTSCDVRYMIVAFEAVEALDSTDKTATITFTQGDWFPFSTGAAFVKISAAVLAGVLAAM